MDRLRVGYVAGDGREMGDHRLRSRRAFEGAPPALMRVGSMEGGLVNAG